MMKRRVKPNLVFNSGLFITIINEFHAYFDYYCDICRFSEIMLLSSIVTQSKSREVVKVFILGTLDFEVVR